MRPPIKTRTTGVLDAIVGYSGEWQKYHSRPNPPPNSCG